jgi:hypothetical protein
MTPCSKYPIIRSSGYRRFRLPASRADRSPPGDDPTALHWVAIVIATGRVGIARMVMANKDDIACGIVHPAIDFKANADVADRPPRDTPVVSQLENLGCDFMGLLPWRSFFQPLYPIEF